VAAVENICHRNYIVLDLICVKWLARLETLLCGAVCGPNVYYNVCTMKPPLNTVAIARAKELRAMGLSLLATASASGLDFETTLTVCHGIRPAVNLPDLPGLPIPADIAPRKHSAVCPATVIAQIRQMRQDRYTKAQIASALGVGLSTVANYAPIGPNTRPAGTDGRVKMTPETHREIHRLRFVEFLSYDKIAAKTGLGVLTVRRYAKIPPQ